MLNPTIETCQKSAVDGMEYFLRNFSHVPDDRMNWSPAETAKTPLQIAAHTALYAARFAAMIRERKLPSVENLDAWLLQRAAEEAAITHRDQIEPIFRAGTAEALAALEGLTPEDIERTLDSGMGWTTSMRFLMTLPGWHATLHAGQIDYLQTCWGDLEIYV